MAEECGFPATVLADARCLRKVVRDSYPLLFSGADELITSFGTENNQESSIRALSNLLQHLLLLKDSTADERYW